MGEAVVGNFGSLHIGTSVDGVIGLKAEGTLGGRFELNAPFMNEVNLGMAYEYTAGLKIETDSAKKIEDHGGDFIQRSQKMIVLDAQKSTNLIGGENDRSIIRLDNDAILISFGTNPNEQSLEKREGHARRALIATNIGLTLMCGFGAATGSLMAEHYALRTDKDKKEKEGWGAVGTAIATSASLIAAVISLGIYSLIQKKYKVPEHATKDATVELKKGGVEINSGKSKITISKNGDVEIVSAGDLSLWSKGWIYLLGKDGIRANKDLEVL